MLSLMLQTYFNIYIYKYIYMPEQANLSSNTVPIFGHAQKNTTEFTPFAP